MAFRVRHWPLLEVANIAVLKLSPEMVSMDEGDFSSDPEKYG